MALPPSTLENTVVITGASTGIGSELARQLAQRSYNVVLVARRVDRLRELAESSPAIVTPLNRFLGYEEAASIAKQALAERKTIREVVVERGHVREGRLTDAQLDEALDVMRMTRP
jgi:fumarate hydratase class II